MTTLGVEVGPKQLELLHELVPAARVFGVMINPANPTLAQIQFAGLSGGCWHAWPDAARPPYERRA